MATNKIKIYGIIGNYWDGLDSKTIGDKIDAANPDEPIVVNINSPGGDALEGVAIYNALRAHPGGVHTINDAMAFSAGSLVLVAGDRVTMRKGSLVMVHNPLTMTMGDGEEHIRVSKILDKHLRSYADLYAEATGRSHDEIVAIMDAETWYTPEEAVEAGFASETDEQEETIQDAADMAASFGEYIQQFNNVPDPFRKKVSVAIRAQGINKTAVKSEKVGVTMTVEKKEEVQAVDLDTVRADTIKAERARATSIRAVCAKVGVGNLADQLIDSGVTVDAAREQIINAVAEKQADVPTGVSATIVGGKDERENFVEGATQALSARAGLDKRDPSNPYNSHTLKELVRASATRNNIDIDGMSPMQMIGAVLVAGGHSTSDFPMILEGCASSALLKGYEEIETTFQLWTTAGSVNDFRPNSRWGLNQFSLLDVVHEGSEYKYGTLSGFGEAMEVVTHGKLFAITRQAIINDDLNAFTQIPRAMGRAAIRTIAKAVTDILINNPVMADGEEIFSTAHGNDGTAELSRESLSDAKLSMRTQTDADGEPINITPKYLIVPAALEDIAHRLVESDYLPDANGSLQIPNPNKGIAEVVVDARLDMDSSTAWYLVGGDTFIEVAYLNGMSQPYLESRDGWNIDGTEYKVRIDAGVAALDYRTAYRSTGTTP